MATVFVQEGSRRLESQHGLAHLGVPLHRQIYLGLPDSGLGESGAELYGMLAEVAADFQPNRWFTTGVYGYDGHADHIVTHEIVAEVRATLGYHSVMWALESGHSGEFVIAGSRAQKFGAMAMHASQAIDGDLERWGGGDLYTPLIVGSETYSNVGKNEEMLC